MGDFRTVPQGRILYAAIGAGAGLAAWLLIDVLGEVIPSERLYLFCAMFAAGLSCTLLAMIGPLRLPVALSLAGGLALLIAGLQLWASLRFATLQDHFQTPWSVLASIAILQIGMPFLIAAALPGKGLRDYPTLFTQAWSILVRYGAAWLFVGLVWALVYLSDALFGLVGLRVIEDLLEMPPVPYLLTGIVLGLALAVVQEWSDYVSPFLLLRLLRLLVPVVGLVVGVFVITLPFRGLSGLFGSFSSAGILLGMAVGAATLVTTALDQTDADAVDLAFMRRATQALALAVPVLAGLGVWAIWLRVAQYGWTPDRLAAATGAAVVLGYGALYALAILRGLGGGTGWMGRIRSANVTMALVIVGLAVLWQTPVLNPERISANSQVARYVRGTVGPEGLDLWRMRSAWGHAGAAALADLQRLADQAGDLALQERLAAVETGQFPGDGADFEAEKAALGAELAILLPVRGGADASLDASLDANLVAGIAAASYPVEIRGWIDGCKTMTPQGSPGCVLVTGEFLLHEAGPEAMLFYRQGADNFQYEGFSHGADGVTRRIPAKFLTGGEIAAQDFDRVLDLLQAGQYSIAPAEINALWVDGRQVLIAP